MELPIDARRAPFMQKWLDEETPMLRSWHILGEDYVDGTLFIIDGTDDIFCGLTLGQAEDIIKARDAFVAAILKTVNGSCLAAADRDI